MSTITVKLNKLIKLDITYDKYNYTVKLRFKFNSHNSNWLYLNMDKPTIKKLRAILNNIKYKKYLQKAFSNER